MEKWVERWENMFSYFLAYSIKEKRIRWHVKKNSQKIKNKKKSTHKYKH